MPQTGDVEVLSLLRRAERVPTSSRVNEARRVVLLVRGRITKPLTVVGRGLRLRPLHLFARSTMCLVEHEDSAPVDVSLLQRLVAFRHHPVVGDAVADRATAKFFAAQRGLERPFVQLLDGELGIDWFERLAPDLRLVVKSMQLEAQ